MPSHPAFRLAIVLVPSMCLLAACAGPGPGEVAPGLASRPRPDNGPPQPPTREAVDGAIDRATAYLFASSKHADPWSLEALPAALLAFRAAGSSPFDPRFQDLVECLAGRRSADVRVHALDGMALSRLDLRWWFGEPDANQSVVRRAKDELQWLLDSTYADGSHGRTRPRDQAARMNPPRDALRDRVSTGLAAMALSDLAKSGAEVPQKYWALIEGNLLAGQNADGGWPIEIARPGPSRLVPTLLALCEGYAVLDECYVYRRDGKAAADRARLATALERGHDWLAVHFNDRAPSDPRDPLLGEPAFTLFCATRLEQLSGRPPFGRRDWLPPARIGLLAEQQADGGWPARAGGRPYSPMVTAFAMIFLCWDREPLLYQKLRWGDPDAWNRHPRDLPHLSRRLAMMYCCEPGHFRWRTVGFDRSLDDWLESPLLFVSGHGPFVLDAARLARLRAYVERGGFILAESADGDAAFAASFEKALAATWPALRWTDVLDDHPILTMQFQLSDGGSWPGRRPRFKALANGVRVLAFLSPADLGGQWERGNIVRARSCFELAGNVYQYATDRGRTLGRSVAPAGADSSATGLRGGGRTAR